MMRDLTLIVTEVFSEMYEILPYFVVGIMLEAWIRTKKWHLKIRRTLINYGYSSIIIATLLGLISPLCACGILPLTISMVLGGLPLAPAMALLVSSPLMSPAGYSLAVNNIGPLWANAEVAAAIFMGIWAGTIIHIFEIRGFSLRDIFKKELPQGNFHDKDYPEEILRCACDEMLSKKVEREGGGPVKVFLAKMWEGGAKIGKFLLLGILIQVLAKYYLPAEWVDGLMTSKSPLAVLGISIAAIPMHITQITATAILFGFKDLNVSPAAGMALLIGGPVTALPVMAVFISLFKLRVYLLYLAICLSGTMICSYTFQLLAG